MAKHLHIMADEGAVAETVLLPGDPLRAKFIAENFLEDAVCYNEVRGMYGFTGKYKGKRVSVQGTGMGVPSHSIYVNELIVEYGAKQLIRIGSCGSIQEDINLRDIVLAMSASTTSAVNRRRFPLVDYAATANFDLLYRAYNYAVENGKDVKVGSIITTDLFYDDDYTDLKKLAEYGVLVVEMESAELFATAAKHGVKALSILTVSDHIFKGEKISPEDRQKTFTDMMEIALSMA